MPSYLRAQALGLVTLLAAPCFAADAPAEAKKVFRAGAVTLDITPTQFPVIVNCSFQEQTAGAAVDRLHARALVLDDGQNRIAMVVVDSCMLPRELLDQAKELAHKATGIPVDRMLISATHSHSAPSSMGCLGSDPDPEYPRALPDQLAKAIQMAHDQLEPARVGWAVTTDDQHTHCRNWILRTDRIGNDPFGEATVRANMHPGHQNPNYIGPSGPDDPGLSLLSVQALDGRPIALLANYSMHYFGAGMVSADYFGVFAEKLNQLVGKQDARPPMVAILSQGTSGDLQWMDYSQPARREDINHFTGTLVDRALEAYREIKYQDWAPIVMRERKLTLERRVADETRLAWAKGVVDKLNGAKPNSLPEIYAREQLLLAAEPQRELKLQALRIGELGITAIPNEVFAITGLKLKYQSPLTPTFNIELANGAEGYIPPPELHKFGGYNTWAARTAGLEVRAEPVITEALLKLLEEVSGQPRRRMPENKSAYATAVLTSKPWCYWRLDDIAGRTAADATGQNRAGELEDLIALYLPGPHFEGCHATGDIERAVALAGGRIKHAADTLGDTYSVEFWFWNGLALDARPVTAYLFSLAAEGRVTGDHLGLGGTGAAAGRLLLSGGDDNSPALVGTTPIGPKTWNHVVLVRQGRKATVYLNGEQTPEIAAELEPAPAPGRTLFLGGRSDKSAALEGRLAEAAVFDRALPANEVLRHLQASAAPARTAQTARPDAGSLGLVPDPPRDPAEALRTLRVRSGFEVELVAAEPLVMDPVAIAWGADGKLWVVEMADYPLGLDGKMSPGGRVRWLTDTDGDGKYDKSTLFLDKVNFPTGIIPWRDGVIVTAAPEIFYAADTDGDGRADKRETLYKGFVEGNPQLRVNGLQWGLDGWLYCANGWSGGVVTSVKTGETVDIRGRDLRIQPDNGAIDPQSGVTEFGRSRDDWGSWFGCDNSNPLFHFVLDDHYLRRNAYVASPDPKRQLMAPPNPRVFPLSQAQKRYHTFEQSGRFTSACAVMIYRDELLFGAGPTRHAFVCEPVHNLVHHELVEEDGVSFSARRPAEEQESEFLASDDQWFRPVMTCTGPDGALWVVDMYRYMIEHPEWLPAEGKAELAPFYRLGEDKGRIYRIYPTGKKPRAIPKLSTSSAKQLTAALDSKNGWQRDVAQQQLIWKKDPAVPAALETAAGSADPLARLHALAALANLDALSPAFLARSLADSHAGVRREAIRLAEPLGEKNASLVAAAVLLAADPDAKVRQQLAYTLGAWSSGPASAALAELATTEPLDPAIKAAILSSVTKQHLEPVLRKLLAKRKSGQLTGDILEPLLGLATDYGRNELVLEAFDDLLAGDGKHYSDSQLQAVAKLLQALGRRGVSLQKLVGQRAGAAGGPLERLEAMFDFARRTALDADAKSEHRAASILLLGHQVEHLAKDLDALTELLEPRTPADVQSAAAEQLSRQSDPRAAQVYLTAWPHLGPSLRREAVNSLLSRPEWTGLLLDALENGKIAATDLDAANRQRLSTSKDATLRDRAVRLLARPGDASRQQVLERYASVLKLAGQAAHGKELFQKKCAQCHRFDEMGFEVGPNLASLTDKSAQSLLVAILDPSRAVETRYVNYVAVTSDGRSLSGVLASEAGNSITLLTPEGKQQVILRGDLEELKSSGKSLMPDGLEQDLQPQDVADLIVYIGGPSGSATGGRPAPQLVKPQADGSLRLLAGNCELAGSTVVLEEKYGNLGYWHTVDNRATWTVDVPTAGRYRITLDYAMDNSTAGNQYVIESGTARFVGKTRGTGTFDDYVQLAVGEIELKAGKQKIVFGPTPELRGALIDLKEITLAPVAGR